MKVVGKHQKQDLPEAEKVSDSRSDLSVSNQTDSRLNSQQNNAAGTQLSGPPINPENNTATAKEAAHRESSFIDAFFANDPTSFDRDLGSSKSWRQTALQRRSATNIMAQPKVGSLPIAKVEAPATALTSTPARETTMIPSSQALVDNYPYPKPSFAAASIDAENKPRPARKAVGWSVPETNEDNPKVNASEPGLAPTRSTSEKLEGLPKDDIDFLSAADIRAAMGAKRSGLKSSEEKKQDRLELEVGYATAKPESLDEVVEAHVVNNHYVRRTQQELERARITPQAPETEDAEAGQTCTESRSEPAQMESSIDRMRRWVEESGASLSKHFWQDPIEAGAPSEADMQFAKQMAGLGKGRRAREHISDDLQTDLPMCKGLMERLKNDENRVEHAVYLLRSPRKVTTGAEMSRNLRTIRERRLRNTYERTEKQFESACQALRLLDAQALQKATNAFKRRLGIASRVLHKNHTLTRMLTWSAQARLDEPDLERGQMELYSEILTRLATMRDTQLALARLMDHAVQVYGVSFKPADEALSRSASNIDSGATEITAEVDSSLSGDISAKLSADTAAAAHLTNEIQSQKAAMHGLSDDGYTRASKQIPRRTFEDKNPLAHSLFRPFNIQLDSLGRKTEGEEAADKLKEAFKQRTGDKKLVQEVRQAYEDVYGPITVEHRQVPQVEESSSTELGGTQAFETLEERHVNPTAMIDSKETKPTEITAPDVTSKPAKAKTHTDSSSLTTNKGVASEPSTIEPALAEVVDETPLGIPSYDESTSTTIRNTTPTRTSIDDVPATNLPTHYTILVHDPQTDALSITTSTSGPPRDTSPALPIHQALSLLKAPAKFIPYITSGLEVVTAKRHMLVLRNALDETSSTRGFETISAQPSVGAVPEPSNGGVNPIDGTTRLSPTGYSGVEQSQEQLERDFEERRQAAAATEAARGKKGKGQTRDESVPKKRRGGVGGVVKTAIWASAVCYIVGVTAEVLR